MSDRSRMSFVLLAYIAFAGASYAQQTEVADEVRIDAAMRAAFPKASPDWLARLKGDQIPCPGRQPRPGSANLRHGGGTAIARAENNHPSPIVDGLHQG
jgi:hypothetical protein